MTWDPTNQPENRSTGSMAPFGQFTNEPPQPPASSPEQPPAEQPESPAGEQQWQGQQGQQGQQGRPYDYGPPAPTPYGQGPDSYGNPGSTAHPGTTGGTGTPAAQPYAAPQPYQQPQPNTAQPYGGQPYAPQPTQPYGAPQQAMPPGSYVPGGPSYTAMPGGPGGPPRKGGATVVIVVVVLVALLIIGGSIAAALLLGSDDSGDAGVATGVNPGDVSAPTGVYDTDLSVGMCLESLDYNADRQLTVLPCSLPHTVEVIAETSLSDADYPGEDAVNEEADSYCTGASRDAVGDQPIEHAELRVLYPTQTTWDAGDRLVSCLAQAEPGVTLIGSIVAGDAAEG